MPCQGRLASCLDGELRVIQHSWILLNVIRRSSDIWGDQGCHLALTTANAVVLAPSDSVFLNGNLALVHLGRYVGGVLGTWVLSKVLVDAIHTASLVSIRERIWTALNLHRIKLTQFYLTRCFKLWLDSCRLILLQYCDLACFHSLSIHSSIICINTRICWIKLWKARLTRMIIARISILLLCFYLVFC